MKCRFIFETAVSANGYLADGKDSLGWLFAVKGPHPDISSFSKRARVLVMGANTYRWLIRAEDIIRQPEKWEMYFGRKPVFVFSHNKMQIPDNSNIKFLKGKVKDSLKEITESAGSGIVWVQGGGDLAGQFYDCGCLDEINLSVAPVFLKSGKPLFPRDLFSERLKLVCAEKTGDFARLKYKITRQATGRRQ